MAADTGMKACGAKSRGEGAAGAEVLSPEDSAIQVCFRGARTLSTRWFLQLCFLEWSISFPLNNNHSNNNKNCAGERNVPRSFANCWSPASAKCWGMVLPEPKACFLLYCPFNPLRQGTWPSLQQAPPEPTDGPCCWAAMALCSLLSARSHRLSPACLVPGLHQRTCYRYCFPVSLSSLVGCGCRCMAPSSLQLWGSKLGSCCLHRPCLYSG